MIRFPDFFLVGSSKAGTTGICDALSKHPEICFSKIKEPNFFSSFETSISEIPSECLLQYQSLFHVQSSQKRIGEGSVKYLNSSNANYWIKKYNPSAKILIILRNPIHRVVSLYEMYNRLDIIQMNPEEAFSGNSYLIKQCLLYQKILLYINSFSREQVLIMIFDDFLKNPDQAFRELCQFLGVRKTPNMVLEMRNKGGVPKSNSLNFLKNRSLIEITKTILPSSQYSQIDGLIKSMFFKKVNLDPFQREELKKFFHEDVKEISDLIERDLCQEWKFSDNPNI